jgi:probable HAF family extracellular repeat protein
MQLENASLFVSYAAQSTSRPSQEKETYNHGNVGRRLFLIALILLANAARLPAQSYAIADLGALPGNSTSRAYGLNNLGQAVGVSDSGAAIATLFRNGTATNMNTLNAGVSVATCISGSSLAAGYNIFSSNPNPTFRAFVYGNGGMTDIQSDSLFPSGTQAYGINSSGMVVGQGWLTNESFHVFLYAGGRMVDLGGGFQASASAINDAGQIVGNGTAMGAFLYSNGKMVPLGVPSGANSSWANAINSTGKMIAGNLFFNSPPSHASLHSNGGWSDLGAFPGAVGNSATGVNSSGQVVGIAFFPVQSYHPFRPGKHVGFIHRNGALVDLNTLIPSNSGFTITDAIGINDPGQIVCDATNSSNVARAVLLSPK